MGKKNQEIHIQCAHLLVSTHENHTSFIIVLGIKGGQQKVLST